MRVVCHLDREPRPVLPPEELERALEGDEAATRAWEVLAPSRRKEFARWIEEGKKKETREARAAKALLMLREGKKLK
ncbi:MAG: YdeI/OmpD-associated family protein [Spirochaetota bacterium]